MMMMSDIMMTEKMRIPFQGQRQWQLGRQWQLPGRNQNYLAIKGDDNQDDREYGIITIRTLFRK